MPNDQNDNMEKNQEQSSTNIEKQTQIPEGNQEMGFQQIRCKEEITRDSNYKTCEKSNWYNPNGGISGLCGFLTSPELKKLSGHWTPFLALGLTLMILGFMAIGSSFFVTLLTVAIIGVLLMVGGVMQIVNSFYVGKWSGFLLHVALGILYLVVGFLLLDAPMLNAITLTFLLAAFFIIGGLIRIVGAMSAQFPGWIWSLFNGIVTFLLGVLIYKHWPSSGLWVIGLFVGIEMVFAGWYWVMFAVGLRNYRQIDQET